MIIKLFKRVIFISFFLTIIVIADEVNKIYDYAQVIKSVDSHKDEIINANDSLWRAAELGLKEHQSSKLLIKILKRNGFSVKANIAGMPTAFIASFGKGKPVVGILAEYDALPGLSQKAVSKKVPVVREAPGHGCAHNVFGAGSMGAAIAVKEAMQKLKIGGTVKLFGCPAEETLVGKVFMARAGIFNDLDVCLDWHPSSKNMVNLEGSRAMNNFKIIFYGKTAHGAVDPWKGRSALDAVEIMNMAVNLLREHTLPENRIHYVISNGGDVPNVVPPKAAVWYFVRGKSRAEVDALFKRVLNCAKGAAIATETEYKLVWNSAVHGKLVNQRGSKAMYDNFKRIGPPAFSPAEQAFAKAIQKAAGKTQKGMDMKLQVLGDTVLPPKGGSTDVAEVSRITPTLSLRVASAPVDVPWHSWCVVATSGMSIGQKAAITGAKVLALTALDFFTDKTLLSETRKEFKKSMGNKKYRSPLPKGVKVQINQVN
jgi:aminobenzoyl-glutamate utilization protein B